MKNFLALAVFGCCCFTVIAFAQNQEGTSKFASLLPVGTSAIFHESSEMITIEIVNKKTKSQDFDDASNKYYDEAIANARPEAVEHLKQMKENASQGLTSRVIYEVSSVGADHFVFKPKELEGNSWRALPFNSIRAINSPSNADEK